MTSDRTPRTSLIWQHGDCVALAVLLVAAAAGLGWSLSRRTLDFDRGYSADPARLALVRQRVDPNTAEVASLRRLPDIGPATAQKIIVYRRQHAGPDGQAFTRPEDLEKVPGIGPATVEHIREYLTFRE